MKPLIITIDGPAGTGKSTAAKLLASRLEIPFLDTGAMYRAVAWRCLRNNIAFDDEKLVAFQAKEIRFEFSAVPWKHFQNEIDRGEEHQIAKLQAEEVSFDFSDNRLLIDGNIPGNELRTQEVSEAASVIATLQTVRNLLVDQQRKLAGVYSLVTEGRDQGTVVFPNATCKFFLTATAQTRAQRRWMDLQKTDPAASKEVILKEIQQRDERDRNRKAAPLKPAADAIVIDNSEKSLEQVAALLVEHVKQAIASEA